MELKNIMINLNKITINLYKVYPLNFQLFFTIDHSYEVEPYWQLHTTLAKLDGDTPKVKIKEIINEARRMNL